MKPKVFFSKQIKPETLSQLYHLLDKQLPGNIAFKLHSGEKGNQNYIKPEFFAPFIDEIGGTVVECNTAYPGARNSSKKHQKLLKSHQWSEFFQVDLLDETGPDLVLEIPDGKVIKKDYVGKNLKNYQSMIVLSHFKGHPMGGYGGALKQLSIGCASSRGKAYIHTGGRTTNQVTTWIKLAEQDRFLEAMADAASAVVKYFQGNMVFINIIKNISVDCDCCAIAEDPCMQDIGILASTDPIAIDQACIDLVYAAKDDPGQAHFLERVESRHGVHTIEAAAELGFGSREYELIEVK